MKLTDIKGVGKSTLTKLNKLKIKTVDDLIYHLPFRYEFLKETPLVKGEVLVNGRIKTSAKVRYFKKINSLDFAAEVDRKLVKVIIFNRGFLKRNLTQNKLITIKGKYDEVKNTIVASQIYLKPLQEEEIVPIYHLTEGLSQKKLQLLIDEALKSTNLNEVLPYKLVEKNHLLSRKETLKIIHNPKNDKELDLAKKTFIYEEIYLFLKQLKSLRYEQNIKRKIIRKDFEEVNTFINKLPFKLTEGQKRALDEILTDLKSDKKMLRILQGDVGCGKTIVAFLSAYFNYLNGYQTAIMAPTEILALQHFSEFKELFQGLNISLELLTSSSLEKAETKKLLEEGTVDIVIGTHALLESDVKFKCLSLVIIDEQHRFGVEQRERLLHKGEAVDILYLTATPIPRTLALTLYSDVLISSIKELPKGRKEVRTKVVSYSEIKKVLALIYLEIKKKNQVYVVAPLIEGGDENSVEELVKKFKKAFQNRANIAYLHGKMKPFEKELIMQEFKAGKVDILISTTVVEVGVDNPNATLMVVYDANMFGLATLHQLRGRVGRGDKESFCVLVSRTKTERLKIIESINDGFKISEEDFRLRGSGDIFGTLQSGIVSFKLASFPRDLEILKEVKTVL